MNRSNNIHHWYYHGYLKQTANPVTIQTEKHLITKMLSVIAKKCDYDLLINQSTSNIYLRRFGLAFSENYNLCFVFHFLLVDIIFFFKYLYCRLKLLSVKKKIITLSKFSVFFSLILLCECLRLRFACCEHQPI